MLLKDALTALG